jgi:hypothetical protein
VRGFVPAPEVGRFVGRETACVRVDGRRICAEDVGRFGIELEGRLPINGGSLGLDARPCVGVAGRKVCADGVGRIGREAEGSPLASDGMMGLDDGRCVAACATCAESGVGRFGEEGKFSSSDSGGAFIDEGRSDVGVGRRADESKDEEGRMDVAVGRSVVEDGLEDDEEAEVAGGCSRLSTAEQNVHPASLRI